jgi:hypothetical protein
MRILFLVSLLFLSTIGFSQKKSLSNQIEDLYNSDYFKSLELLVTPDMYLDGAADNITHIAFYQDTAHTFNDTYLLTAGIDKREGFDQIYSIGTIYDYMISAREVGFHVEIKYTDGSSRRYYKKLHFDDVLPPSTSFQEAQYMSTEYLEHDGLTEL